MYVKEKKLSKKAQKAAAIEALRTEDGFLPQYSDFYFEKKKQFSIGYNIKYILGYLLVILFFNGIVQDFGSRFWSVYLCIIISLVTYYIIKKAVINRQMKCGTRLEEYNFIKTGFFGEKPPISYSVIEQAVSAGDIHYGKTGLRIGHGAGKLVFHYEIGDSKAQKHMEECHTILQHHLTSKLPPFEKKGLDLLDRKYFYEKSRRTHTISLLCALLGFLIFYSAGIPQTEGLFIIAMIFCIWECLSIYYLGKSGKLSERNHVCLQKEFADYPNAKFGWKYTGYTYFIVVSVIVICVNYWIITYI